jgi:enamine deaminase RidA (YjgF/YER057c/UK114 family)
MTVHVFNPDGLPKPEVYRQVALATGSRLVFVAGQVARDAGGQPVGAGDLAAQVDQSLRNVVTAVEAAGGSFADVAKLTIHVVDWTPDKLAALGEGVGRAAMATGIDPLKPVTLLSVAKLTEPDLLVEIEATAVLD